VLPAQLFVAHRISNTPSVREPFDEMITGFANTEEFLFTPPAAFVPHPSILSYKMGSVVKRIGSKQFWRGIHCRDFVEHGLSFCSFRHARKFVLNNFATNKSTLTMLPFIPDLWTRQAVN